MCPFPRSGFDLITLTLQNSYFSSSEWADDDARCGHCDNCTRDPTSVVESDVTLDAKRMLAVARALHSEKIKMTTAQLAEAARGSGPLAKRLQLSPSDRTKLSSQVCGLIILRNGVNPGQTCRTATFLLVICSSKSSSTR
jgi:hypothetical protein